MPSPYCGISLQLYLGKCVNETTPNKTSVRDATVVSLFLILVSAVWIETDIYRIASLILVLWGIACYLRADYRVSITWMGWLCLAWVAMVLGRLAWVYASDSPGSRGASEGIYLLPAFYMTVGYMAYLNRRLMFAVVLLSVGISLILVINTVDLRTVFSGSYERFLFTNNRIHSAVGAGMIVLAAIDLASYVTRTMPPSWTRRGIVATCYAAFALSMIGIYGTDAKGVWVAIALALCVHTMMSLPASMQRRSSAVTLVALAAFIAFVLVFSDRIWAVIGPSIDSSVLMVIDAVRTGHPVAVLREAIEQNTAPEGLAVRLKLWNNAYEVFRSHWLLGAGIGWHDLFYEQFYRDARYDIIHNGYLEVAARYGLLGLGFYTVLYGWTIAMARRATRLGLIPLEAYRFHVAALIFFLVTILTNSNNRLAIGETYMMVAAAFGFYCSYLVQRYENRHWLTERSTG